MRMKDAHIITILPHEEEIISEAQRFRIDSPMHGRDRVKRYDWRQSFDEAMKLGKTIEDGVVSIFAERLRGGFPQAALVAIRSRDGSWKVAKQFSDEAS